MPNALHLLKICESYNAGKIHYRQADLLLRACFVEEGTAVAFAVKLLDDCDPVYPKPKRGRPTAAG